MDWSKEDRIRAKAEGWNLVNGALIRVFRPDGTAVFAGPGAVADYIAKRAETSEWHRDVYLQHPWTGMDQHRAGSEGWVLTTGNSIAHTIIRDSQFLTPQEAHAHVLARAQEGSLLHTKAIAQVAKHRLLNG